MEQTSVVHMVRRGRMRHGKARSRTWFPYKEELSVGKMEFAAVRDDGRHLTGDVVDTMGGGGFIIRRDIGLSGLLSSQDPRASGSQWSRGREAHIR